MEELNLTKEQIKIVELMEKYVQEAYNLGYKQGYKAGKQDKNDDQS